MTKPTDLPTNSPTKTPSHGAIKKLKRVYIEITNACNLQCSFCPIDISSSSFMSVAQFTEIVSQLPPFTNEVALHILGEPLTHPHLSPILDVCADHKLAVHFVTNGILLQQKSRLLIHPALKTLSISLQSFTDNFPQRPLLPHLVRMQTTIDQILAQTSTLSIQLRLWDLPIGAVNTTSLPINSTTTHSQNDLQNPQEPMRAALSEVFGINWSKVFIDVTRKKQHFINERLSLHFDSRFQWPSPELPERFTQGTCKALSHHIAIDVHGTVVPCCLDAKAQIPLGSVTHQPLYEIINSRRASQMKRGFEQNILVESLCRRCDFAQRFGRA